jgi:hypothetical protein
MGTFISIITICVVNNNSPALSDCMEMKTVPVSNRKLLFHQMV